MSDKKYWEDTCEYKRILNTLDNLWLTQKEAFAVCVEIRVIHKPLKPTYESIIWWNPFLTNKQKEAKILEYERKIEELKTTVKRLKEEPL